MSSPRRLVPVVLPLAAVLAGLAALELFLRLCPPAPTDDERIIAQLSGRRPGYLDVEESRDPLLGYALKKDFFMNGRRLTESHGVIRRARVEEKPKPGVYRVAVLGDSIAARVSYTGDPNVLRFPDELERLLNERSRALGRRFEVLNFGADGYGTAEEARVLEDRALALAPDMIVLEYCMNDPVLSLVPYAYFAKPRRSPSALLELVERRLADTALGDLAGIPSRMYAAEAGPLLDDPALMRHWRRLYDPDGPPWARVRAGFKEIAAAAGRRPVVVAIFPLLYDFGADKAMLESMTRRVDAEAKAAGFVVVDLGPEFRKAGLIDVQSPRWDIYHPGDRGHAVAARALARAVEETLKASKK